MGWKSIIVSSKQNLKLKDNNLIVKKFDKEISFFLDDINLIVIENYKGTLTVRTIIELAKRNITLIINDLSHDPTAILLKTSGHYTPLKNLKLQLNLSDRTKQRLQQQLIKQKIINQKLVLEDLNISSKNTFSRIDYFLKKVIQGDKTNCEAQVARIFFNELYGSSFIRFTDTDINKALNYGYKILASTISSSIVRFGLHPTLGIFHITETNYFNLTYDLIEPFRPLVDWIVSNNHKLLNKSLSLELRIKLIAVLDYKVIVNGKVLKVKTAIDVMVKSYISFLRGTFNELILPKIYLNLNKEQSHELKGFSL